jgi:hypothetical protein
LELLLKLSGRATVIKTKYLAEWSAVFIWKPEDRYNLIGSANEIDARLMLDSAGVLLNKL